MPIQRGCFITLEGVDGAGKSTHIKWVVEQLQRHGLSVVSTREPGGTALGEQLRQLVLTQPMNLRTETLLMFAGRCEHIETVIKPALAAGSWVVCDRFTDATYAYQGGGRELGFEPISRLEQWVHSDLQPDRTWLFDVPLAVARERLARSRDLDRFEQEGDDFFERTRRAYHDRLLKFPDRLRIVDSTLPIETVRLGLAHQVDELVQSHHAGVGP
ncbi:dTMP kinase [Candidimonas sp. SYP-B2681]|uniref:dTMP kinase n=1 Tax=Candidimonas sp. SYP-B2681 TaxID=2497686 RepID=UPI000F86147A|nr:dTMP kinase [Candidimonas sp. SYP-B2681]RTZ47969.1 dTMP kinase [Candidimonas sp. SYP-B2681]